MAITISPWWKYHVYLLRAPVHQFGYEKMASAVQWAENSPNCHSLKASKGKG
jgi:hypothetical protein